MIETIVSKEGGLTYRIDGQLVASKYAPRADARKWVGQQAGDLNGVSAAIFVGVGAGYRLAELKLKYPHLKVIGLDKNSDLTKALKKNIEFSRLGVEFIAVEDLDTVFSNSSVVAALQGSYRVFAHSLVNLPTFTLLREVAVSLSGQNLEGLVRVLRARGLFVEDRASLNQSDPAIYLGELRKQLGFDRRIELLCRELLA